MNSINSLSHNCDQEESFPIMTLEAFILRQNEIQKRNDAWITKWWNHNILLKRVLKLADILEQYFGEKTDPIVYLKKLYFEENLSIESVFEKIKEIYIDLWETQHFYRFSNSMQVFLRDILGWKLKNPSENKTTQIYKKRNQENVIQSIIERQNQRKVLFLSWYIKSSTLHSQNFDALVFENFSFKYEKFIYLLENVFCISKKDFQLLQETKLWEKFISDRFSEICDELNITLTLSHKDIKRVFEKFTP